MAGLIALVGGDEFRPGCEDMDRAILASTGLREPELLILPTAAAGENPTKAASNGVAYFSGLGASASSLMVLGAAQANDAQFLVPIDTAEIIYLTGGNPAHLLDTLVGSLLLERLRQALDRGAILAGSSAGAMVLGSWMRFRTWRESLGLVPGVVTLPHHEKSDHGSVATDLADSAPSDVTVLGIDGKTCYFGGAGSWKVLGAGKVTVYRAGRWLRYQSGDIVTLGPG